MIDRNQLTGILLIMAMLLAWQFFSPKVLPVEPKTAQQIADSIKKSKVNSKLTGTKTVDSVAIIQNAGDFKTAALGQSQNVVLENNNLKITFSTQGGAIKKVELKNYKTYANFEAKKNSPLVIFNEGDKLGFELPTTKGNIDFSKLYFNPVNGQNCF